VLEIGSFLGVLCFALRKVGFQVTAQDIPEFQNNPRLQERYRRAGIECVGANLKRRHFPYPDAHFDFVIMCETLEHLNFNPLPAIKEINRVMKPGGLLYLTVPNQLSAGNRLKLLRGETIQASVGQFYEQLDLSLNMIVGLHWREYSKADLFALLEPMGFAIRHHYFYQDDKRHRYKRLKFSFKDVLGEFFPIPPPRSCAAGGKGGRRQARVRRDGRTLLSGGRLPKFLLRHLNPAHDGHPGHLGLLPR
jgi:SAM-dependent methyltransferase